MTPESMAADAAGALAAGTNMTLVRRKGQKMPPKFPRGELLCENFDGSRCYSTPGSRAKTAPGEGASSAWRC